jgi:threonine dehydrogenase-like Zn-dependent dehydrogenase
VYGGAYGVGRIASIGPDSTVFQPGQLVIFEPFVRARDDPDVAMLWGAMDGLDDRTKRFTRDNWRNACWADYVRAPLENTWAINEDKITALGLQTQDLVHVGPLAVVYAGLRRVDVKAGETVLIAPATGIFSGGTVHVARAIGANVIAASRNADGLRDLEAKYPGIKTVQLKGDDNDAAAVAAHGPIDVFVDVSPPQATGSPHLGVGMQSVRTGGRVCLMGGRADETLPISNISMVFKGLTICGSWMYDEHHVRLLIQMVEVGIIKLDKPAGMEIERVFPLEQFREAMEAAQKSKAGKAVIINST